MILDASRASLAHRGTNINILAGGSEWPAMEAHFQRMDDQLRRRLDVLVRSGMNPDNSFSDVPVGLSEAQINRLPRTKATAIQCSGNS